MQDGALKIAKLIFMRDLKELGVIRRKLQRELEVFLLLFLRETKPSQDRNALES